MYELLFTIIWFFIIGAVIMLILACIREACAKAQRDGKGPSRPPPAYRPPLPAQYLQPSSRGIAPEIQLTMCPECEATILANATVCPHCNTPRPVCMVCRYPFPLNAPALKCPHCGGLAHHVHILEYLKGKGVCPQCRQPLDVQDLIEHRVGTSSDLQTSKHLQFLCIVCHCNLRETDQILQCPHCEGKAHRTHFLEYLKVKGKCPNCQADLDEHELLPVVQPYNSDADEL